MPFHFPLTVSRFVEKSNFRMLNKSCFSFQKSSGVKGICEINLFTPFVFQMRPPGTGKSECPEQNSPVSPLSRLYLVANKNLLLMDMTWI